MEAAASLSSSSVLRNGLLRATVCCFVGGGSGGLALAERMRWRRSAGARDFRYDPLSYALNFDDGGDHGVVDGDEDRRPRRWAVAASTPSCVVVAADHADAEAGGRRRRGRVSAAPGLKGVRVR